MKSKFQEFRNKYCLDEQRKEVSLSIIQGYKGKLPDDILKEWEDVGWGSYGQGFFWLVNPSDFQDLLKEWKCYSSESYVFARTSFGDMYVWKDSAIWHISVHYGELSRLTKMPEILFDVTLCSEGYVNDVLDMELHIKAVQEVGSLKYSESYCFEPALALGGTKSVEKISIVKMREHVYFLSQIMEISVC